MIFDLALGFFFVVSYHLIDTIYKYCAERSHTSGGCEDQRDKRFFHTDLSFLSHDLYRSYLAA